MNKIQQRWADELELVRQELNVKVVRWNISVDPEEWLVWDGKELVVEQNLPVSESG